MDDFDQALSAYRIKARADTIWAPHTQENFKTAYFMPELFDNNSINNGRQRAAWTPRNAR
ncbi:hypothetical protein [Mesorhizobium sp. M0809]|uniref:hypothetical protein n=1 Tax=Mesorhizobium sp. M0809 TaxID=2957003 RepID=UPI003338FE0D